MSCSPARRMRRQQARQIAKQLKPGPAAPPVAPAPDPARASADRLQAMGVTAARSILWTPPGAR